MLCGISYRKIVPADSTLIAVVQIPHNLQFLTDTRFSNIISTLIFFASFGLDMGRVILAMFVGYIVASAAKGRERVATTTLVLILCAMAGAASLVWVARGHDSFLWTLCHGTAPVQSRSALAGQSS